MSSCLFSYILLPFSLSLHLFIDTNSNIVIFIYFLRPLFRYDSQSEITQNQNKNKNPQTQSAQKSNATVQPQKRPFKQLTVDSEFSGSTHDSPKKRKME